MESTGESAFREAQKHSLLAERMDYETLYKRELKHNKHLSKLLTEGAMSSGIIGKVDNLKESIEELNEELDHYQNKILHLESEKDDLEAEVEGLEAELEGFRSICNEYLESKDSPWEHLAMWCDEKTAEITNLKDELENDDE